MDLYVIFWIVNSLFVFLFCVLGTGVLIPQILLISYRKKLFDNSVDGRRIHQGAVPRLGGIAFMPVAFLSIALMYGICNILGYGDMLVGFSDESDALAFCFSAIMILYLVGIADDLIGIRYVAKFVVQIICGLLIIAGGLWIDNLHGLLFIGSIPLWIAWPVTVFAVVFIINAVNLVDGIDGLASGLCAVATLFYGVIFIVARQYVYALLSFATLGVLIPFFYYNVFGDRRKRKKIFMGDTGSLTIGMMLCILSLRLCGCVYDGTFEPMPNVFVLAFSPLIIPCFDVVRVYIHRVRNGKNPFLPDKNHIHHKLLAAGMKQRTAMATIVGFSVLFTLCNIVLSCVIGVTLLLAGDVAVWILGNLWLNRRIRGAQSVALACTNAPEKSADPKRVKFEGYDKNA